MVKRRRASTPSSTKKINATSLRLREWMKEKEKKKNNNNKRCDQNADRQLFQNEESMTSVVDGIRASISGKNGKNKKKKDVHDTTKRNNKEGNSPETNKKNRKEKGSKNRGKEKFDDNDDDRSGGDEVNKKMVIDKNEDENDLTLPVSEGGNNDEKNRKMKKSKKKSKKNGRKESDGDESESSEEEDEMITKKKNERYEDDEASSSSDSDSEEESDDDSNKPDASDDAIEERIRTGRTNSESKGSEENEMGMENNERDKQNEASSSSDSESDDSEEDSDNDSNKDSASDGETEERNPMDRRNVKSNAGTKSTIEKEGGRKESKNREGGEMVTDENERDENDQTSSSSYDNSDEDSNEDNASGDEDDAIADRLLKDARNLGSNKKKNGNRTASKKKEGGKSDDESEGSEENVAVNKKSADESSDSDSDDGSDDDSEKDDDETEKRRETNETKLNSIANGKKSRMEKARDDDESENDKENEAVMNKKGRDENDRASSSSDSDSEENSDEKSKKDDASDDDKADATKKQTQTDARNKELDDKNKPANLPTSPNVATSDTNPNTEKQLIPKHDAANKPNEKSTEEDGVITDSSFASLGVLPPLCEATTALHWTTATKIQKETIPHALAGRDVIGLAETGSGKTAAFAIPILQSLLQTAGGRRAIFALILSPTRELAFQIHEVIQALGRPISATSVCIVGGIDLSYQAIALAKLPHIVIATPGRLNDHLENTKGFHLRQVMYLVLDEADRMLSLDFEKEINSILEVLPDSSQGRKTMLFSATMTSKVRKLQRASLSDPVRIEVSTKFQTPDKLLQHYVFLPAKYKDCYFAYLINDFVGQSVLVFAATCNNVQRLAMLLRNLGFPAICLHGQMTQPKRLAALYKFKSKGKDILICTDIASRGLDIPTVDVVINYDLPGHGKDYIHRVGRTARAGRSGMAIAMVTQYDVEVYQRLEGLLGRKLPKYELDEEMVLILLERVSEASRLATKELKEQMAVMRGKKRGRKGRDEVEEDGVEDVLREELRKGYYAGGSSGRGGGLPNQRGSVFKKSQKRRK